MKKQINHAAAAFGLGSLSVLFALSASASDAQAAELEPAEPRPVRIWAGVSYRGGMKLETKGGGSRAAGTAATSTSTSGGAASGTGSESASVSYGYTGGDRTFGSGTTALGSGSVKADGTYTGGDYSAAYDDVYFADRKTTSETVGGRTTTKTSSTASGALSWDDDDLGGLGARLDAEFPLFAMQDGAAEVSAFTGVRGWWGVDGDCSGGGAGVRYTTTTSTSGASRKTTESLYTLTAPLTLGGTLDFENAEVFEANVVTYAPVAASSSSKSSSAFSAAKIEADADMYQIPLGIAVRCGSGRLSLALRAALLLCDIDAEATRTEVLATTAGKVLGSWREKADKSKFALGAGADVALECALDDAWRIWIAGGCEWVDGVEFDVGPQKVEIDASAWTASAGLSFAF